MTPPTLSTDDPPGVAPLSISGATLNPMASPLGDPEVRVVELYMMDKKKYFPLTVLSGFCIRGVLYPFSLIKTRLQIQVHNTMYRGTLDAFLKIRRTEGVRGLYKGFWVSNLMVVSQLSYITTYENVRTFLLTNYKHRVPGELISVTAGFCASTAGQTFLVPIDIVSQHLMMLRAGGSGSSGAVYPQLQLPPAAFRSRWSTTGAIIREVYRADGVAGFYKGYAASLATYAPNSALWWLFYLEVYYPLLLGVAPDWVPRLALQCVAAPLGGCTTALFTNCMDVVRARIQVERTPFMQTWRRSWREEGMGLFVKGISARFVNSTMFSFFIILGYESIKRFSLLPEYENAVRW